MTVFITRALSHSSEFKELLTRAGWKVEGQSLVEFSPLPFREIPAADWIFFTSKNAVQFFFQQLKSGVGSKLPPDFSRTRWAALGEATAKALAEYVGNVDFVGTGEPKRTAATFRRVNPTPGSSPEGRGTVERSEEYSTVYVASPLPSEEEPGVGLRILFPAARHSRQSVMSFLTPDFQCIHFPIYDNRPVANAPHSDADVLVFTSPLNAQAYFSKNGLERHQRVVAIGETTAEALRELGISEIEIAGEPNERGLAEAVLRLQG